jgi:hypothetical protein
MFRHVLAVAVLVAVLTGRGIQGVSAQASPEAEFGTPEERAKWPTDIEQAVARLMTELPETEKREIRATEKNRLFKLHSRLGLYIRNFYGLRRGNHALMRATGKTDPDDASMVIIQALWRRLNDQNI